MAGLIKAQTIQETIGTIKEFAGSSAPTKWLVCNGTAISRTTYSDLFSVIGTTYGAGDGSTTFNIPDFQGRSPKGVGTSSGGTDHVAESITLGLKQNDKMQRLTGTVRRSTNTGIPVLADDLTGVFSAGEAQTFRADVSSGSSFDINFDSADSPDARTGDTTTGKCLGVNFIIKAVI